MGALKGASWLDQPNEPTKPIPMLNSTQSAQAGLREEIQEVLLENKLDPQLATDNFVSTVHTLCAQGLMRAVRRVRINAIRSVVVYLAKEQQAGRMQF